MRRSLHACLILILAAQGARISPHHQRHDGKTPSRPSAAQVIARMLAKYDNATSYQGTVSITIVDRKGKAERLIRAAALGNRHGSISRSHVEIIASTADAGAHPVSQVTRVDDGRYVWTSIPRAHKYSRASRRPDRLSNIFQPLLQGAHLFGRRLKVRTVRNLMMESKNRFILSGADRRYGRVEIHVDADNYALLGAHAIAANGDELRVETVGQRWNGNIAATMFRFEPSTGDRMIPQPRPGGIFGQSFQ